MSKRSQAARETGRQAAGNSVVVYDPECMPQSEAIKLSMQFKGKRKIIEAEVEVLKSLEFGHFDANENIRSLEGIINACKTAKGLLLRSACVLLACLVLSGCGGNCSRESGIGSGESSVSMCPGGHCKAN